MNEKIYKTMSRTGTGAIVMGITITVVGVTVGVLSIISGSHLLKSRKNITF